MSPTRAFISRAALLVKVTARISPGRARPVARMWAMRVVSTRVLPVPAPASTSTGPSSVSTACRCSGLSPARYEAPPPRPRRARAAMPPGAGTGGSAGSKVRFTGSATMRGATDSHPRKMAPGRGFYEACVRPRHSGLPLAASPESIITGQRNMDFRARGLRPRPGMTASSLTSCIYRPPPWHPGGPSSERWQSRRSCRPRVQDNSAWRSR